MSCIDSAGGLSMESFRFMAMALAWLIAKAGAIVSGVVAIALLIYQSHLPTDDKRAVGGLLLVCLPLAYYLVHRWFSGLPDYQDRVRPRGYNRAGYYDCRDAWPKMQHQQFSQVDVREGRSH